MPLPANITWEKLVGQILQWYRQYGRHHLPFRQTRDPYKRWLAEVLLQQTRIEQGLKYWHACLNAFPTIEALVQAGRDRLLQVCAGIGYYRRLNLFFDAASQIVARGTQFPATYEEWRALPGVGKYMAAILSATLHDEPYLPLDGNVRRVLARFLAYPDDVYTRQAEKEFEQIGRQMFQFARPSHLVEALIDLGAVVCRPRRPHCGACPLASACQARIQGIQMRLPVRRTISRQTIQMRVAFCHDSQQFLLIQYREDELWAGLWGLPRVEELPITPSRAEQQWRFDHFLTHRHVVFDVLEFAVPNPMLVSLTETLAKQSGRKVRLAALHNVRSRTEDLPGMPAWMHRILTYFAHREYFSETFGGG